MTSLSKQLMFEELLGALNSKSFVFFARYEKLSVSEFSQLRRKLEKVSDRALVVKNTIARRVFEHLGIKNVNGFIKGSTILTLGDNEPQIISKVLVDFAKEKPNFEVTGACLDGVLHDLGYVNSLAALPSREVLVATVISRLNAPISGFVGVMSQLIRSLAITLDQISKQKATV
jgi:large subunit ribosomal protein L10